jgi:hypothetical protein
MNQAFEVLPFGGGELEGEMERSTTRMPRGGGRGRGARPFTAGIGAPTRSGPRTQVAKGPAPMGHMPFRARHGRRAYFGPPWPYYYGPYYGPGWPYPAPSTVNVFDDGGTDAGPNDAEPQGELGTGGGCNCPRCRQRAMAFEVLPFGR